MDREIGIIKQLLIILMSPNIKFDDLTMSAIRGIHATMQNAVEYTNDYDKAAQEEIDNAATNEEEDDG